ncbi:hypothetical protein Plhal304r1_c089g0171081 [Plasmopara halstedii]
MVKLRLCFINHKVARYNRITPPSKQQKERNLPAASLHSSLRQSLQASQPAINGKSSRVVKPSYYILLWLDDLYPDRPQWQFDIEIHNSEDDIIHVLLTRSPSYKGGSTYTSMVSPLTINYEIESMTRGELFDYVGSFFKEFESRPPLDHLATIEAYPGLLVGAIATKANVDTLALTD